MAGDPIAFAVFTVLPLLVLTVGVLLSIIYVSLLGDRRMFLATGLFALMALDQTHEVWQYLVGIDPHTDRLAAILETAINLLAVGAIGYVFGSLETERKLRTRLAVIHDTLRGEAGGAETGLQERHVTAIGTGTFGRPRWLQVPVMGRLLEVLYATLPLGNTAALDDVVRVAVQDVRISFPIASFEVATVPSVTVFGDPTYLQEILETVLELLIVYNDSSDPTVDVSAETDDGRVTLKLTDNGSGLPPAVVEGLTGNRVDESESVDRELRVVHAFLETWGGSLEAGPEGVAITLLTPR